MVDTYLSRLSGVLLPGGGDIDPALFGEAPHPNLGVVQPERDSFELALCRAALQRGMPVLGICRGAQVLNVALGGTLIQDIPAETASPLNHRSNDETELRHEIDVEPGTLLARIIGEGRHPVNSQHHQSVRVPAPGLIVSAGSPKDGIIEAVEYRDARFVLGLQFHPECLPDLYLGIFREFVRACAGESQRV
jgi:putative glutamine amidotransferase